MLTQLEIELYQALCDLTSGDRNRGYQIKDETDKAVLTQLAASIEQCMSPEELAQYAEEEG